VRTIKKELRKPAEELRLRAALARIEADRVNAGETASAIFVQGRTSEEEGERLFRDRNYQAAQLAFSRATRLFQQAQEVTWEERVRRSDISSDQ
jgi:type II secretory pathway component PulK